LPLGQCGLDWDWDKVAAGISQSRNMKSPIRVDDIRFKRSDGEERYLGITIQPLNGDDECVLGLTIIGADITDRKKLEAHLHQSQKMEALGQLAAGIAHEINTPTQFVGDNTRFFQDAFEDLLEIIKACEELLAAVKSNSVSNAHIEAIEECIRENDLDYLEQEIPVAIQHTLKGVERITKIVQAMKIFAHPGMVAKEPTEINKEIEKTITITRNEWKYVADMITDLDPFLPPLPCFRAELNQVFLNLIVNAAHAIAEAKGDNPSQKGTIRISTHREGDWAKIRISDTGAGIPAEIRHKIFDLFFTTKGPGKGSGQGLAISHSVIVEKHHGTLDLETQSGKGTTFIIGLPMEANPEENE
jgi:signal transduction histidine kinase